jgi:Ca-activated chloride channel family protein
MFARILTPIGFLMTAIPAMACDIALVLAVDVSGSVDPDEYHIQMQGLATAIGDPAVAEALLRAEAKVMVMQWTGLGRQSISIPWRSLDSYEAAAALSDDIAVIPRVWRSFSTAIGEAVELALVALNAPEVAGCTRRVIDISGDGASNEGVLPEIVRGAAMAQGVTINALAIEEYETDLVEYFRNYVITGPNSFAVAAATFEAYPERIRQKLLREVVMQLASVQAP